jgi:hypothetical protein
MAVTRGVRRLPGGGVRVRLAARERELLRSIPEQLRPILAGEADSPAHERLFPPAYRDERLESEYRDLVGESLVAERLDRLDAFARTLDGGESGRLGWTVDLTAEDAHAWLSAINDARLTLGVLLGITDESQWEHALDHDDPSTVALAYLGWLQEELLQALTAGLPE